MRTEMANDLDIDAIGFRERIEHFDAALVFNDHEDSELAEKYMNMMNAIELDNGQKIKVCLYTAPNFKAEAAETATDVVQYCTHIFCVLTKNFPSCLANQLIKEEAIGLTRLAVNGEEGCPGLSGRRYCVRPLHTLSPDMRDYKIPPGLSTIRGIDMSNENRSKKELKQLFEYNLHLRLQREHLARYTPVVNIYDQKPVTYFQHPNTSKASGELLSTVDVSTESLNRISGVANKDTLPNGQSYHHDVVNNDSTQTSDSTVYDIDLSSENRSVAASINNDATQNGAQTPLSIDAGSPDSLNRTAPGGGDETQVKKLSVPVKTSSSDHLQHTIDILKDTGMGEHFMEYTSGLPSVRLEGFNHISRPVNNETNGTGRDAKKYINKSPNGAIHFINCSNIQIGERGNWNIDKPNTVYSGTGQNQPTPTNEIVTSDSEDSDDDSEYEMGSVLGYGTSPGTKNQSSSKPMEDLAGTQNDLNITSDKLWNRDSCENTEVKQLVETGPGPELPSKSFSNDNQAVSSNQEGLGDNFLNVMNILDQSDVDNLSLSSFNQNLDNLLIPQPTQDATPEVCDEHIRACLGSTGVIENLVLDDNVNSNSLHSIWQQLRSQPRSVSFHNIAQLIGLQPTDTETNRDVEETD
ncbi:uncharacterized protein LOC126827316 isoform X1 [Patella vulgata]|uniref:uncharacterized protein LOC126827316 isoform X1 n=1 Tax=Patella vulgata TaxID=6465 RepID=UPI0024A8D801|nr:uncharacterized protein LOC126827316 isoform X1 [Patella vulgata]